MLALVLWFLLPDVCMHSFQIQKKSCTDAVPFIVDGIICDAQRTTKPPEKWKTISAVIDARHRTHTSIASVTEILVTIMLSLITYS
jgi:hypothetical protein